MLAGEAVPNAGAAYCCDRAGGGHAGVAMLLAARGTWHSGVCGGDEGVTLISPGVHKVVM